MHLPDCRNIDIQIPSPNLELQTPIPFSLFFLCNSCCLFGFCHPDSVIGGNGFLFGTAEQIADARIIDFARKVPQGDIDRRLGIAVATQCLIHGITNAFDPKRVETDQVGSDLAKCGADARSMVGLINRSVGAGFSVSHYTVFSDNFDDGRIE